MCFLTNYGSRCCLKSGLVIFSRSELLNTFSKSLIVIYRLLDFFVIDDTSVAEIAGVSSLSVL